MKSINSKNQIIMKDLSSLYIIFLFLVGTACLSSVHAQEVLEVDGAVKIDNTTAASPQAGTIRWNGSDFEGWNGVHWVSLTGNKEVGSVTDIDGNTYKTIRIGEQIWMAENLRTTKYQNGDNIIQIENRTDWINLSSGAWCWYNNDSSHDQPFGKLYNGYVAIDLRNVCPMGWHVPSDPDWQTLIDFLDSDIAGGKMKSTSTAHWDLPNVGASNESGFTAVGSGRRLIGAFTHLRTLGHLWSSTEILGTLRYIRMERFIVSADLAADDLNTGLAIRCIKN